MRALKIIALLSIILLCISGSIGIAAAIYVNTCWLRNEIYLSCNAEQNADYAGDLSWTLVIDKNNDTVKWEALGSNPRPRTTEYLTASAIGMKWANDDAGEVAMHLNRLDGNFRIELLNHRETPALVGRCSERHPQF